MIIRDTICALATPPGIGGLAVIRISGEEAFSIADSCFRGKVTLSEAPSHTIHYGKIFQDEGLIDTVTASVFRSPHSYTGENVVEIGCHGGTIVSSEVESALIKAGARSATAGEFTKRAFLNAKLDLTQVEAIADLIHTRSIRGSHVAARQLAGGFTKSLSTLREELLDICGLLELELDFSEEEIEFVNKSEFTKRLRSVRDFCLELKDSFRSAEVLRMGYYVGIVGFPNAGKSSLMNALLDRKRSIVSDIPGTTRDYVEETLIVNGMTIRIFDTAGIRDSDDRIEMEGVQLVESVIRRCNLLLIINDITKSASHSDALMQSLKERFADTKFLLLQNKVDLIDIATLSQFDPTYQLLISSQTNFGLDELKKNIGLLASSDTSMVGDFLLNARHAQILTIIVNYLEEAIDALESQHSNEIVAIDVRSALKAIGDITGDEWSEDLLNSVFSRFCIGK